MTFSYYSLEFEFRAIDLIRFPKHAGNALRGALGMLLSNAAYTTILNPVRVDGPSGYRNPPRPFVLRCAHLNGMRVSPGETFQFRVNLLHPDLPNQMAHEIFYALHQIQNCGIGPYRGRAELISDLITPRRMEIPLAACSTTASFITIEFKTLTDLRNYEVCFPLEFKTLFRHVFRRVSCFSTYSDCPCLMSKVEQISLDFQHLESIVRTRKSSKTGDAHNIGGFIGKAGFRGEMGRFLPWLNAAAASGIGRHTVWGNGEIEIIAE